MYTLKLAESELVKLEAICKQRYIPREPLPPYSRFAYSAEGCQITAYTSGKVVMQGKQTEAFVSDVLEPQVTLVPQMGYEAVHNPEWVTDHAGLDESGKGDLFGPLVSACIIAEGSAVQGWLDAGIADSKRIGSDAKIFELEKIIRRTPGTVLKITRMSMPKYNQLYANIGNLNRMLAWMHARSLEDALAKKQVPWGLLDQFSKQPLVQRQLKKDKLPEGFELKMRTKAESDPVVAAASICARAEYVRQMKALSDAAYSVLGEPLKRGASAQVKAQGRTLAQAMGPEKLGDFAKMHFKTAKEILSSL